MHYLHKRCSTFHLFINFILLLGLTGCFHNDDDESQTPPPPPAANTVELSVSLNGNQEVPAVVTNATGSGTVTLDLDTGELSGSITTTDITVTAAHIHKAFAGHNGSVLVTLVQDSSNSAIWRVPDNTTLSAEDIQSFSAGELYVNVHSDANPSGELRGQILPDNVQVIWSTLSGDNEVPAVSTSASGRAALTVNTDTMALTLHVMTMDLSDASAAHIHSGMAGENGDVALALEQDVDDMNHWSVMGTFTQAQYDALWLGGLYINVHSATHPSGELRGQILPDNVQVIWSTLSGDNEVPAVSTSASGRAALTVNTDTMALTLHVMTMDLSDASAAHIHTGMAGENGGVALALEQDVDDMTHWSVMGTFTQAQYDALWLGGLYINVHSATHPSGELRGQLLPDNVQVIWSTLSGDNEVPAVSTSASGRAALTVNTDTMALTLHVMTMDLSDASAAHIHSGMAGENGGVALALEQDVDDMTHWSVMGTFTQAQYDALWLGGLYINVHSATHPSGELRGQLLPDNVQVIWSTLSGDNEVPAVSTSASGRAALTVNTDTMALTLHVMTMDLSDASAAHIHSGMAGENGDVALALEQDVDDMTHWSVMGTFTQAQYDALWLGGLYINVHSATHPSGELRGQL